MARDATQTDDRPGVSRHAAASLIVSWADAWNAHDANALAYLVATDVEFINVAGRWLRGRHEFFEWHHTILHAHLRDSNWTTRQYCLRPLGTDMTLVHLEWRIGGERGPDGSPKPQRDGLFTWIVSQQDGSCLIAAAHNTNLAEGVLHRLSAAEP